MHLKDKSTYKGLRDKYEDHIKKGSLPRDTGMILISLCSLVQLIDERTAMIINELQKMNKEK